MDSSPDPFTQLHDAASWAREVMQRGDGVAAQIESGDWDKDLSPDDATDTAEMLAAVAEHVRSNRALAGSLAFSSEGGLTLANAFRRLTQTRLPLNRKERYYTGTVLPFIIASDGFAYLDRFLRRCGLPDVSVPVHASRDGEQPFEFFTEYGFAESLRPQDHQRFSDMPTRDTPDLVIVGEDWLLAVEAKMFHGPTASHLNDQLAPQRALIEAWARDLSLPRDRVRHVSLLPELLAREVGAIEAPVVTWEQVLDDYRVVGPAYWVGVLDEALSRYGEMVSRPMSFGDNADAHLVGEDIARMHAAGTLTYHHVGRQGGLTGRRFLDDVSQGKWRTVTYEVRHQALLGNPNWFPVADFLAAIART